MAVDICLDKPVYKKKYLLDLAIESKDIKVVRLVLNLAQKKKMSKSSLLHHSNRKFTSEVSALLEEKYAESDEESNGGSNGKSNGEPKIKKKI